MADAEFATLHEIVRAAHSKLSREIWDYSIGGADTETTLKRNRLALDSLALKPYVLNDVTGIDCSVSLLGHSLRIPVVLAPVGSVQHFDEGGGATVAKAAAEFGTLQFLSSVCTPGLEAVAKAADCPKVYQLYLRGDEDSTDRTIERAIANGYCGFCLTVDLPYPSRRERDIAKGATPTAARSGGGGGDEDPRTPVAMNYQAALNWEQVARIKEKFDIPLILKGINRREDARRAVDHGVEVVYVSNHGGRQLDHGRGAIDLLPEIADEVAGRAEILVDGGFCRGTDILKGLALGARAVGIGKLQTWALAAGGAPALVRALELLRQEIWLSLSFCGVTRCAELDPSYVTAAQPITPPSATSAFPLIDLPDDDY